jgi:hypothetical protein
MTRSFIEVDSMTAGKCGSGSLVTHDTAGQTERWKMKEMEKEKEGALLVRAFCLFSVPDQNGDDDDQEDYRANCSYSDVHASGVE